MNRIMYILMASLMILMSGVHGIYGGDNQSIDYEFDLADMDAIFMFKVISPYAMEGGELDIVSIVSNNKTTEPCINETAGNTFTYYCEHKFNESHYNVTVNYRLSPAIMEGNYGFEFSVVTFVEDKKPSGGSSGTPHTYTNTKTINIEYVQVDDGKKVAIIPLTEDEPIKENDTWFNETHEKRMNWTTLKPPFPIEDEREKFPTTAVAVGLGALGLLIIAAKKKKKKKK